MTITEEQIRLHKGMLLSLAIHIFCVASTLFFMTFSAQHPETVRVLLTLEPPGGGGGGEINQMKVPEKKVPSPPARQTHRREHPTRQLNTADFPPVMERTPVELMPDVPPILTEKPVEEMSPLANIAAPVMAASGGGKGAGSGSGLGSGTGTGSGTGIGSGAGRDEGSGQSRDSLESLKTRYLQEHFAYIRDLIMNNLTYPPMARKVGWQGKVRVSFVIRKDGRVEALKVVESSGHGILDKNVVETIRQVQPFPKPPVRAELVIPVVYMLKL